MRDDLGFFPCKVRCNVHNWVFSRLDFKITARKIQMLREQYSYAIYLPLEVVPIPKLNLDYRLHDGLLYGMIRSRRLPSVPDIFHPLTYYASRI